MAYERIPLDGFSSTFGTATELSSVALGGKIVAVSDEFFAEAFHLLLVEPAPSLKGQFGPKGALYSGWESRRHNPAHDWCIIKLGTSGSVVGFDIDTTHFNGNEAPQASVDALYSDSGDPETSDSRWSEILPRVDLGPTSRHLFKIPKTPGINYVKLNMYPDGGIARFRVYGDVAPVFPSDATQLFDVAHVFAGGRVVFTSDQHFGVGSNLILPGRGKDMGDGWETKRSREKGHKDWAIIKLGAPSILDHTEIDTAHFMGNFPESIELHGLNSEIDVPATIPQDEWTPLLPRTKTGPHRRHYFHLENVDQKVYTHVKLTIHPDGGVKRVRIIGRRADGSSAQSTSGAAASTVLDPSPATRPGDHHAVSGPVTIISSVPLTPEAFAPFGQVVQAYADPNAVPRGTKITPANQGTASKFHKLAPLHSSYPAELGATPGLSVYRCKPVVFTVDGETEIKILERHPYTNQAFIPMGSAIQGSVGSDGLDDPGDSYLVVVAKTAEDGKPDLGTLRAFTASAGQGIVYNTAVWHQPMTVLHKAMDFTCVETQVGNGHAADCEIIELDSAHGVYRVKIVI
ncbi:hypothetical protein PLICRDRAFT_51175 [Plicaturopsis crispa FD-325 SS-3]|nr:hypothetical protein PLICRDRAFT_51175 [Plicaturopsis crispa FD-325 SS-3]